MKTSYKINQLRDYSTLFSRSEVNRWMKNDFDSINLKIQRYDSNILNKKVNYLKYLKDVYKILRKFYANEYIYKNEFLNKWLIKELGTSESIIYNEFRLGKAIADLVMFNGCSKVFEIKTLLDKESRLNSQLQEYKKIFNEVYVIVPISKIEKYSLYDDSVGIISYDQENSRFDLIRNSVKNLTIDSNSIMEILHTKEYKSIVGDYHGEFPDCNDFDQYEIGKQLINEIPAEELNKLFIKTMKKRKINNNLCNKENKEFNQIFLSQNLSEMQKIKLFNNLNSLISY
ncbi:sce7726 family protein [Flavobacterium branchiarum]|uniref:Sce7726 family protein n=1 Tax=Flavobacterium branchiarum TaxID=1114870 RepID=A0ABV5FK02_9FLAO|nr:sce7726 family protein [Flavobacterium branchiarum]MDN3672434.1 sce7726 family protein [Flavobacterium branchiarum]